MAKVNTKVRKIPLVFLFLVCLFVIVFSVVAFRLYQRVGVFGCGDECINYTAGYFLLLGKSLYGGIFFNHQPILAFVSAAIQWATQPKDIYHLVLYHRLFMIAYSLGVGVLLLWRFRVRGVLFLLLYESTKYYMYGYQFIGEAFIIYPLVYLFGLFWESFESKKLSRIDVYLASVFTCVVLWTREPYVPVALALGGMLFWRERNHPAMKRAALLFGMLVLIPFILFPFREYVEQVFMANIPAASVGGTDELVRSVVRSVFYPLLIFFRGSSSYVRVIEVGVSAFFWVGLAIWLKETKKYASGAVLFGILALAGIRTVPPGTMFYEAFHMLPWYALFVAVAVSVVTSLHDKRIRNLLLGLFVLFSCWAAASPQSFIWERINTQSEFESQYAKYSHYSQAIQIVSTPKHTLFLDVWDDIIYWESRRDSSYPLSLYIPTESSILKYQTMRTTMFRETPPDMYYSCPALQSSGNSLSREVLHKYVQLTSMGKPGCLYITAELFDALTESQWKQLTGLGFSQP